MPRSRPKSIEKNCDPPSGHVGTDTNAKLTRVETLGGKVLLDTAGGVRPTAGDDPMLTVATLDFLAAGGSGYDMLKGAPQIKDLGIIREAMKDLLANAPATFAPVTDGRWAASVSITFSLRTPSTRLDSV